MPDNICKDPTENTEDRKPPPALFAGDGIVCNSSPSPCDSPFARRNRSFDACITSTGNLSELREERGDAERALALDHKPRDLSSHNGSSNGHSPVLNLSKTAGSGSVGEQSGSEAGASHRSQDDDEEDDNLSEDLEDDNEKDEDLSDVPENLPLPAPGSESPPQALNYSQIASAAVAVSQSAQDPSVSSTETLLRNIQGLLKVAADNARQQERQINYEKGGPLTRSTCLCHTGNQEPSWFLKRAEIWKRLIISTCIS
ncbi:Dachshund like protein 2 [Trachymyrmex septentrionalis]|uniref:Dachshund like protein 2 n=1 Tax=Trachymyrmex septentrionalis TaxID=34720 RepID=A0A195F189_9HYME|nr:Dachshund like protein 2 [Trachymyrmex septentrionalis]